MITKSRPELPKRMRNIPAPSEYLETRYRQSNQAIIHGSEALLKAQLKAGHHTLTKESLMAVIKKYGWQYSLQPTLF
jgi:hypothetical protein